MGIMKGFRRLVLSFDVQDRFVYESHSVESHCTSFSDISPVNFILVRKSKDRPHGLPMWFLSKPSNCSFSLTSMSFRQSGAFPNIVQCCCNSCSGYTRTGAFDSIRESLQLLFENRQCCKLLEGKVEMFSQFRSH